MDMAGGTPTISARSSGSPSQIMVKWHPNCNVLTADIFRSKLIVIHLNVVGWVSLDRQCWHQDD